MDFTFTTQLHYLIHFVDGEYVAHCLDADLVGTGASKDQAIDELNTAVRSLAYFAIQTQTFDVMGLCKQAPERYWDKFEKAKQASGTKEHSLDVCPELEPVTVKQRESKRVAAEPIFRQRQFTYSVAELERVA
jgi:hypothetical protein